MGTLSLKVNEETRNRILGLFGKTSKDVEQDLQIIREWLKSQTHLPETPSDKMIEYFLVNNKFSLENTKQKIDMYYNVKNLQKKVLGKTNPKLEWIEEGFKAEYIVPLPKLKEGLYRIILLTFKNIPAEEYNVDKSLAQILNLYEIRIHEDYMFGDVVILDQENFKLEHAMKITPSQVKMAAMILKNLYNNRVKEIHIINHNPAAQILLKLAKLFLTPKLCSRIHLHDSIKSLQKHVPLDLLPKDYGGEEKSLDELKDLWKQKLEEYRPRFDKLDTMEVDESLRPTPLISTEDLGICGSFKKLDVD